MIASAARFLEPVPYPGFLAFDAFARARALERARLGCDGAAPTDSMPT